MWVVLKHYNLGCVNVLIILLSSQNASRASRCVFVPFRESQIKTSIFIEKVCLLNTLTRIALDPPICLKYHWCKAQRQWVLRKSLFTPMVLAHLVRFLSGPKVSLYSLIKCISFDISIVGGLHKFSSWEIPSTPTLHYGKPVVTIWITIVALIIFPRYLNSLMLAV